MLFPDVFYIVAIMNLNDTVGVRGESPVGVFMPVGICNGIAGNRSDTKESKFLFFNRKRPNKGDLVRVKRFAEEVLKYYSEESD
jgi:hypothetical protein